MKIEWPDFQKEPLADILTRFQYYSPPVKEERWRRWLQHREDEREKLEEELVHNQSVMDSILEEVRKIHVQGVWSPGSVSY